LYDEAFTPDRSRYWCDPRGSFPGVGHRLEDLMDMAAEPRQFIQEEHTMVGQRHLTRPRHLTPPISPASEMVWWGAGIGWVVIHAVQSPVRLVTRWMRVVSMASARGIAGRRVVSRRASIDLPAPGGPSRRTLWSERLHRLNLRIRACRRPVRPSQKLPAW
jgi:hypothetical protein